MDKKSSPIRVNVARAKKVFRAMEEAWKSKEGIWKDVVLPESRHELPTNPRTAANYLFFASLTMRGGVVSDDPVRWLSHLYLVHPDLFDPTEILKRWNEKKLCKAFCQATENILAKKNLSVGRGSMGPRYQEFARSWLYNAKILAEKWQGNVLNVFDGVKEFEEAFARIDHRRQNGRGLVGIRRKIFSLLTIWLQDKGMILNFPTPLPIDFHALRVLQSTGVIELTGMSPWVRQGYSWMTHWKGVQAVRISERITDAIAMWSQWFLWKNGFDHKIINPAMWVLSRTLCADHLQNGTRERTVPNCLPEELRQKPQLWPANYRDPCQHCPVRSLCQHVTPSGPYYRSGMFVKMERVLYQHPCFQPELPGMEGFISPPEFTGRQRSKK